MLLKEKNAVIYGAGGAVGEAVAMAFASEGARVFLVGRNIKPIIEISDRIKLAGGRAHIARVDALNASEVEEHLSLVMSEYQKIDISFNLVSINDVQGIPLLELPSADFLSPVNTAMNTQFITATAAARHMIKNKAGIILMLSANAAKKPTINSGGFGIACAAIESLSRQLAKELGRFNIRVICLRSAGSPDAKGVSEALNSHAAARFLSRQEFEESFVKNTMLNRLPMLKEVANAAVIMASGKASAITSAIVNVTCGELSD
ncbi:MAG: SDR family oxidoreductase [Ferruginibacter sp.]